MKKILIILLFFLPVIVGFSIKAHHWITDKSFEYLPEVMDAFRARFHDPVISSIPPYYMYPDIYEKGHTNERLANYADKHYHALVKAIQEESWSTAEKEIGYLAHYCGDAASPTQNSSKTWGKIDDSYDILVDLYLDDIVLDENFADPIFIENIYQYYLDRCQQSVTFVDSLIIFCNESNSTDEIWLKSKHIFQQQLNQAIRDLHNVLFTAWDAAGRPENFPKSNGCSIL